MMLSRATLRIVCGLLLCGLPVAAQQRPLSSVTYAASTNVTKPQGVTVPLFPPRTVGEHVGFGALAGIASGLLVYGVGEVVIDHHDHSLDSYAYIGFPLIGAATGAGLGYIAALIKGAPNH